MKLETSDDQEFIVLDETTEEDTEGNDGFGKEESKIENKMWSVEDSRVRVRERY